MVASPRYLWKLDVPEPSPWAPEVASLATTHYKLCAVHYEITRDNPRERPNVAPPGLLEVWFSPTLLLNRQWVEARDTPGLVLRLDDAAAGTVRTIPFSDPALSLVDAEKQWILLAAGLAVLPPGSMVDQDDRPDRDAGVMMMMAPPPPSPEPEEPMPVYGTRYEAKPTVEVVAAPEPAPAPESGPSTALLFGLAIAVAGASAALWALVL